MSNIIHVRVETINYGGFKSLEVAFNVKDSQQFFVTYPTVETILNYRADSVREKIASKSFKAFLGGGRTVGKISGKIVNKPELVGATAKVSLIKFDDFVAVSSWEAFENRNESVAKLLATGFSDSFRSIAYEQIGETLALDERQKWLESRMQGKVTRRTLTDSIKSYLDYRPEVSDNYRRWIYSNVSDSLNIALFGKKASRLCIERGCDRDELRNTHDEFTLSRIDKIESVVMIQIDSGMEPMEAMKFTLETVFRICA